MHAEELIRHYAPGVRFAHARAALDTAIRTALPWTGLPGSICYAANLDYLNKALANPNMAAVITSEALCRYVESPDKCLVITENPQELFFFLHNHPLHLEAAPSSQPLSRHIAPSASIHPSAVLADEHVHIGEHACIGPFVVIGEHTYIGDNTVIGPHVVIGEDGLYPGRMDGKKCHIRHWGGVSIGANCRIGAHSAIARSTYWGENTSLGDGVHMAFHCSVGHDCRIGQGCDMSAHVCIGGRTEIGENAWLGIGACLSNTLVIGRESRVIMGSAVIDNVPEKASVSGNFAISHLKHLRKKALES